MARNSREWLLNHPWITGPNSCIHRVAPCVCCEVLLGFNDSHAKCVPLLALAASHSQTGWIAFAGFFMLGADWTRLRKNYRDQERPHHLRNDHQGHFVPLRTAVGKGRDLIQDASDDCARAMIAALQSLRPINICTMPIDLSGMSSFKWRDSHHGKNNVIS